MNIQKVIRYKLKADRVAENEQRIRAVFHQIHEVKPEGVGYTVYKLADGVSFVHVVSYETEEAQKSLTNLPAFREFQAQAKDRFEESPIVSDAEEIGGYDLISSVSTF